VRRFWFDPQFVREYTGENGIDAFDLAVFGNDDEAASLAVSDHRPIWANFSSAADDDGITDPTQIDQDTWGRLKTK
jgi:hypothetical protein